MENNTAIFNAIEKTVLIKFRDEEFPIDLTQGDLEDSWNTIMTKDLDVFDTNFWADDTRPVFYLSLYEVKDGTIRTDIAHTIKIVEMIGTPEDYFKVEETNSFRVDFRGFIVVDGVSSLEEAQEKVKTMEVDFNDMQLTLIN